MKMIIKKLYRMGRHLLTRKMVILSGFCLAAGCGNNSTQFYGGSKTQQNEFKQKPKLQAGEDAKAQVEEENKAKAIDAVQNSGAVPINPQPDSPSIPPATPGSPPVPTDPDLESKKPLRQLTWLWQCQANPSNPSNPSQPQTPSLPPAKPKEEDSLIINGAGQHVIDRDVSQGTDMTLAGDICAPEIQPRDLLFMIDTSVSTNDTDPLVNNSCGRLSAIETIIKSLAVGDNQMGIVTFSSDVNFFTTQFYKKPADLFAAVAPQGNPADIICNDDGTTNYVAPLLKAQELMALGRAGATKELFLISDGAPNSGEEGINEAAALKATGVSIGGKNYPLTIATIMLNGTDTVLEQFIASKDVSGKPMHVFAAQSNQLAKALSDLAENPVVKATMKYKAKSQSRYTEVALITSADQKSFSLPPVKFSFQDMKEGIEVVYQYTNKRGQTFQSTGTISINPAPKNP